MYIDGLKALFEPFTLKENHFSSSLLTDSFVYESPSALNQLFSLVSEVPATITSVWTKHGTARL